MAIPELSSSGVPRGESAILAGYYRDAAKRIKETVLHPPGGTQSGREFRQARAAQQIQQIDTLLVGLKQKAAGWVGKNIPAAYRDGLRRADRQAREAGVRPPSIPPLRGSFSVIDQRTVRVFARDSMGDLTKAADSMGRQAQRVLRSTAQQGLGESDINRVLAGGVIEGSPRETIRRLRDELEKVHGETVTVIDRNGDPISFDAGYYAEMVARTKTREATVTARHERLEELDIDLVAIVGRISTNFCTAFLGQVFSLSGNSTKYPAYSSLPGGGPPFHPNCSKSDRPFIEELASDAQIEQAEILSSSEKLLGMDTSEAQRSFKDLQIHAEIKERYATTARKLFG